MNVLKENCFVSCDNDNCILKISGFHDGVNCIPEIRTVDYFRPKQDVFFERNSVKGIYFILKGVVKVYKNNSYKDQIVRLSTSGEILGHRGIGKDKLPVSAQTLTETELCYIEKEQFSELLSKSATLATNLMLFFAEELNREESKLSELSNFTVLEKGQMAVKIMIDSFGLTDDGHIIHSELLSRKEIGELVGLTANQITKTLKELQTDGLIKLEGKRIFVTDTLAF